MSSLIDRLIMAESSGNPNAVNKRTGASGLTQIMRNTAAKPGFGMRPMDWTQRFDPKANRAFGEEYLGHLLNRYSGNEAHALAAYNWGLGNVDKWLKSGGNFDSLPRETQEYVKKITGRATAAPDSVAGLINAPRTRGFRSSNATNPVASATDPVAGLINRLIQPPTPTPVSPLSPAGPAQGFLSQVAPTAARQQDPFSWTKKAMSGFFGPQPIGP